jgi:hypothetical protein
VGLLLLAPAQFALGGVATLDPLLLPRGAALPFELFALALLAQRRFASCFALLGAAACLHAPSAAGLAVASCCALLLTADRKRPSQFLSPALFFITALPVLGLWLLGEEGGALLSQVDAQWLEIIDLRLAHHIDPGSWPLREWALMLALMGAGGLALRRCPALRQELRFIAGVVGGLILWATVAGTLLARGGEALFDREFALRWLSESRELCACEPKGSGRPGGAGSERRPVDLRERLHVSWSDRSAQSLLRSAQELGASHAVLHADSLLGAPDPQEKGAPVLPEPLFLVGTWALVPVRTTP